ncbi:MAG: aminotransferase class V-fold PLP-dependent enzyme [Holophagaceae bacterium]|nr:aminotransferase class V-fold PLP-dependent enzyme [Holophagaceae bacterium]
MRPLLDPSLFDLDAERLWVMHCSEGPVPMASLEAVQAFLPKESRPWKLRWAEDFQGIPEATKREAAQLIGAGPDDISLTATTSSGLQIIAQGFPWKAGDEVLAPLGEFPSNAWPWMALAPRGVGFCEVPLWAGHQSGPEAWNSTPPPPEADAETRLLDAITDRTRILALSWVRFQDGLKLDLPWLGSACRERGVHLVVDGIQGAGTHRPDLTGVSAFATGGHKGLLAPQGLGFLWTEAKFRALLAPSGTWLSVEDGTNFTRPSTDFNRDWLADGRRLEAGGPSLLGCVALNASLACLNGAAAGAIETYVQSLQDSLLESISGNSIWGAEAKRLRGLRSEDRLGPVLSFHHQGRGPEFLNALLQKGFDRGIYASVREGYLRVAFHGMHSQADVARVAAWITD